MNYTIRRTFTRNCYYYCWIETIWGWSYRSWTEYSSRIHRRIFYGICEEMFQNVTSWKHHSDPRKSIQYNPRYVHGNISQTKHFKRSCRYNSHDFFLAEPMEYFLKEEMLNVLKILFNIGEELKRFTSKFRENRCQKILDSASNLSSVLSTNTYNS